MAAGLAPIAPLSNSQKLFLQRLLVSHVLTDDQAKQLYQQIKETFADVAPSQEEDDEDEDGEGGAGGGGGGYKGDQGYMGNDLPHLLGIINASLVPAFNLEISTVSLPPPYNEDNHDSNNAGSQGSGGRKRAALVKYHAIVNRSNDTIATKHGFPLAKGGPHDMAYFRLVLERIVERGVELLEDGNNAGGSSAGCPGAMNRMELINLRTEMEGAHKDKLSIAQTENALECLENEGWLVRVAPPAEEDDDDSDNDEDENSDEEGESSKKRRRKKSKRPSSSGGSRRKSLKGTFYGIGPRSFMELGEFLQKAGLPGDRMPQNILHRI